MNDFGVLLVIGTRPEATKMAPVFRALEERNGIKPKLLLTGQHREQLRQALQVFGIRAVDDLDVMQDRQRLPELAGRLMPATAKAIRKYAPDYILVHGDTLTTVAVAWTSFLMGVPVGHVEAGLRTGNLEEPFPEEANRRLTDVMADVCLAPTQLAKQNLLAEGRSAEDIAVTGQTGVDAVRYAAEHGTLPAAVSGHERIVTVTLHRRENWPILDELALCLARIAEANPEVTFVYPVHLNPVVRDAVVPVLNSVENMLLPEPLEYGAMAALLAESEVIITDSGGLQEEGAALGVPVVVVRNVSERPEGIKSGILRLAGTDPAGIEHVVSRLLDEPEERSAMSRSPNPYGDGRASSRVASFVAWRLGISERPKDWSYKLQPE